MDQTTAAALQSAYQLIKAGKLAQAQAILIPIVRTNQNIADAWFLLGFALTEPDKRAYAFQQVLRIDPGHQPAQRELARLAAPKPPSPFTEMPDLSAEPPATQPVIQAAQPVETPAPAQPAAETPPTRPAQVKRKSTSPAVWVMVSFALILLAACGLGLWWLRSTGSLPASLSFLALPTSTQIPLTVAIRTPSPKASPTALYTPTFRATACSFDVPLGTRVRCGVVRVPQDRQKSLTNLIDLPVVIYSSPRSDADVVVFLQGGPGAESVKESVDLFDDFITPLLTDHDVLFFDARGTGTSKPTLDCPGLNPLFLDGFYQNQPSADALSAFIDTWSQCRARLAAAGIDPAAFNTDASAADVHDIVSALGYQKVNLFGVSYGTRLGQVIMRDFPGLVRAAVLDSAVPLEAKMFNRHASDVQYALNKVFADCAGDPQCNQAYPDLNNLFNALVQRFDQAPVSVKAYDPATGFSSSVTVNGVDLMAAIEGGMSQSQLLPVIPKAIYDIQNGDYTFLSFALGVPGGALSSINMGTYYATICPEQVEVTTPQELDADLNVSPLLKRYALASLFGSSQNIFDLCQAWGAHTPEARDSLPVKADIPTLVTAGQYDPTTPVPAGQMLSGDLPGSYFFVIPGMGHAATIGNSCAMQIVRAFLQRPSQAPDSTCLTVKSFNFFIPYDGKTRVELTELNDPLLHLQGAAPAGWKKAGTQASYSRDAYLFDPTSVDFENYTMSRDKALANLQKGFANGGLDEAPAKIGSRDANGLSWVIYQSKFDGEPVIIAMGQVNSFRTVAVIMVVSAPEREAFYNGLFIPMLDALAPLK